jgi:hypothetical protein
MTNTEIATRYNLKTGANVSGNNLKGYVIETGNIFCKIRTPQGDLEFSYSELNSDSEFTFEK